MKKRKKHQNNQNIEEDNLNNPAEFCIINREIGSFFDFQISFNKYIENKILPIQSPSKLEIEVNREEFSLLFNHNEDIIKIKLNYFEVLFMIHFELWIKRYVFFLLYSL